MGVVCEAYQGSLNRHVALKFLPERGDLARFRHEARAVARLHHTNIVPVFGVGEHGGRHYYVMQYDDEPIRARRMSTVDRLGRWVRRHKPVAALSAAVAFLLVAVTVISSMAAVRLKKERDAVLEEKARADQADLEILSNRVRSVLDSSPESVPYILGELQAQRNRAIPMLQELATTAEPTPKNRHRLAVAAAVLGCREGSDLSSLVTEFPPSEAENLLLGLKSLPVRAVVEDLDRRYRGAKAGTGRTRLAIALLELGEPRAAREELSLKENLTDRVRFIHDFPSWHGDLAAPLEQLRSTQDPAFRSGLILAIGGVSPESLSAANRETLMDLSVELFRSAPDGATHSAARWCLQRHRGCLARHPPHSRTRRRTEVVCESPGPDHDRGRTGFLSAI